MSNLNLAPVERLVGTGKIVIHRSGAEFRDLERAEWKGIWTSLKRLNGSLNWIIGDWLNWGRTRFGERYALALDATALEYQTLRNAACICGAVPLSRRRDTLSWTHHAEVAPLGPSDQARFLERAEASGWSVSQLRRAIRAEQAETREEPRPPGFIPVVWIQEGLRAFRREGVTEWPPAKRAALKSQLEPLVKLWREL